MKRVGDTNMYFAWNIYVIKCITYMIIHAVCLPYMYITSDVWSPVLPRCNVLLLSCGTGCNSCRTVVSLLIWVYLKYGAGCPGIDDKQRLSMDTL